MEARLEEARAEQARLRAARPKPPALATVAPQGSNIRRQWVAQAVVENTEEEAAPASVATESPSRAVVSDYVPAPFDEDGPVWPDAAAESAFLGASGGPEVAATRAEEEGAKGLPALDALVGRLDTATRDLVEELFRARFVSVKRIQKGWLKEGGG